MSTARRKAPKDAPGGVNKKSGSGGSAPPFRGSLAARYGRHCPPNLGAHIERTATPDGDDQ